MFSIFSNIMSRVTHSEPGLPMVTLSPETFIGLGTLKLKRSVLVVLPNFLRAEACLLRISSCFRNSFAKPAFVFLGLLFSCFFFFFLMSYDDFYSCEDRLSLSFYL